MTKNGRVEAGKTPSVVSGKISDRVEEGEPVRGQEHPDQDGMKKLAQVMKEDGRKS